MKLYAFIFILLTASITVTAQVAPNKYFVKFTDKNNSPYSINTPEEYLSARAIERRQVQGIAVTVSDLPVNPAYLEGVAATGALLLNPTRWLNGVTVFTDDPAVVDAIEALPYVAAVRSPGALTRSGQVENEGFEKPFFKHEVYNVPMTTQTGASGRSVTYDYGSSWNQIAMLRGDELHEQGYRGQGMLIAVLDAGFLNANTHDAFDSLWANDQIPGTYDFVTGGEITFDGHPHGAMVLSTMGGNYPGELIGTAPKASYLLLRSEDASSEYIIEEYNWVSAAEFADSAGADIINSSLGYTEFHDPAQNHTYADLDGDTAPATIGADMAASKGILVVNSLGNEGYTAWYYLSVPSDGDSVIGVGAVDNEGNYASFSSHGPSYDGRVKPNVSAQGAGCLTAEPYGGAFTTASGTSFSSPILAGMAACLWQANREQTNMDVLQAIEQSASLYADPDDFLGHGIPDFIVAKNILTIIDTYGRLPEPLNIYPNPFSDSMTISMDIVAPSKVSIQVLDMQGRSLYAAEHSEYKGAGIILAGLDFLPSGMYIVKAVIDEKVFLGKAVK